MAKIYGRRWEVIRQVGHGGQAQVFAVKDLNGEHPDEMALKWLQNVKRRDRFIKEAKAGLQLNHKNIVRVVDHSTLGDDFDDKDRQFLVMPYASGGSLDKRATLYKGSVDTTLTVAEHLAAALECAHAGGVIHRDVKPGNILFAGPDHDCLLADFGLCLLVDDDHRPTETGEAVGPRAFMAPELEDGGHLDVTEAADLYSLGKVLYYLYSGGTVLPRERHREAKFAIWDGSGIRSEALGNLLDRLICPLNRRIQKAGEVLAELRRIRDLDLRSGLPVVAPKVADLFAGLVADQSKGLSIQEQNKAVSSARMERFRRYCESISNWLASTLDELAKSLSVPSSVEVTTKKYPSADTLAAGFPKLREAFQHHAVTGLDVRFRSETRPHTLLFFTAVNPRALHIGWSDKALISDSDIPVVFLPYYVMGDGRTTNGFLARSSRPKPVPAIYRVFADAAALCYRTTAEKWPMDESQYKATIDEALQVSLEFVKQAQSGSWSVG
jgi:serine/threonine protein kinase